MRHGRRTGDTAGRRGVRARPGADLWGALLYLALVSLFGGDIVDWNPSTILLLFATVVFATFVGWRDGFASLGTAPLSGRIALIGIAALPLLQIVPLPPAAWHDLPGQELRQETLGLLGIAGSWQPVTLEPVSTAIGAVLAAGFVAFVILLLRLDDPGFRRVLAATFAFMVLNIAVGLLQVVSDGQLANFHNVQMGATLLGFFANKNHAALVIACAILLFGTVLVRDLRTPGRRQLAAIGFALFALVCIVATNSRAGLAFGLLAAAIVIAEATRRVPLRWRLALAAAVAMLGLAVASSPAFETVFGRVDEVGGDLRWQFSAWSMPLARRYWLLGSGLESFKTVYQAGEHLDRLIPTLVNAVHDDYLQLVIEAGVPGIAILLALGVSLIGRARLALAVPRADARRREMMFGLATIALFALHSAIDLPLRRPAAWIVFAVALASAYRRTAREATTPDAVGVASQAT